MEKNDHTKEYLKQLNIELPFELKDRQKEVLELIMHDKSALVVLPTSYGKSILAVLQALYSSRIKKKKTVMLAPLRALTNEHIQTMKEYGLRTMLDDGGHSKNITEYMYSEYDIVISTFEKQDSIVRNFNPSSKLQNRDMVYKNVDCIIIDEIHGIEDESRGSNLESYIMSIQFLYPHIKILSLSATIGNKEKFAEWMKSELVYAPSNERPVPLQINVVGLREYFSQKQFNEKMHYLEADYDYYKNEKIMVAVTAVNRTKKIVKILSGVLEERPIGFYMKNYRMAWHYSDSKGFEENDRMAVEWAFEYESLPDAEEYEYTYQKGNSMVTDFICRKEWLADNYNLDHGIDLIVCTPTLIVGRNLPVSRIYVFDHIQYSYLNGPEIISSNRLQQTIGRAGRLKYAYNSDGSKNENYKGVATLYVPETDADELYFRATVPFDIKSNLKERLGEKILAWINSGIVHNDNNVLKFLENAFDEDIKYDSEKIKKVMKFLRTYKFIEYGMLDDNITITNKGKKTIKYYIQPETVVDWGQVIRDTIQDFKTNPKDFKLDSFMIQLMNVPEFIQNVSVNKNDEQILYLLRNSSKEYKFKHLKHSYSDFAYKAEAVKAFAYCFPDYIKDILKPINNENIMFIVPDSEKNTLLRNFSRMIFAIKEIYGNTSLKDNIDTCVELVNSKTFDIKLAKLISIPKIGIVRAKKLIDNGIDCKKQILSMYKTDRRKLTTILGISSTTLQKIVLEMQR